MVVIHAGDPTTSFLSQLYEQREDISAHINEKDTKSAVQRAIRQDDVIMMLGHGTGCGLFSVPDRRGNYSRILIGSEFVQFLRDKTCIGIWCHADEFADAYKLHGLFSGMIISELDEAIECEVETTKEEIDFEMVKFASRLRSCIDQYELHEIPMRMKELDDVKSALTTFNYNNLFYFE